MVTTIVRPVLLMNETHMVASLLETTLTTLTMLGREDPNHVVVTVTRLLAIAAQHEAHHQRPDLEAAPLNTPIQTMIIMAQIAVHDLVPKGGIKGVT